jgi:phosphoribosylformimino-5-aminoimidazole carboxamide ribotide isomerase
MRGAEGKYFRRAVSSGKESGSWIAGLEELFGGSMSFTIYPAIDLRAGKVVRLKEGDPARMTSYSDDPARMARRWLGTGAEWLHVVNLDGAFGENDAANRSALESILKTDAHVQFGGGLRSLDAVDAALSLGVSRVVLGTIAIEQAPVVAQALEKFGAEKIAVGIDARDGFVSVRGWTNDSAIFAKDLARQMRTLGVRTVIFTDIRRDGLGRGLNIASSRELAEVSGLDVIASGGVHTIEDVIAAQKANLSGVIIGRALYEGTIELQEALKFVNHEGSQRSNRENPL